MIMENVNFLLEKWFLVKEPKGIFVCREVLTAIIEEMSGTTQNEIHIPFGYVISLPHKNDMNLKWYFFSSSRIFRNCF